MKFKDSCLKEWYLILIALYLWIVPELDSWFGRYKTVNSLGGKLEMIKVRENLKRVFEMSGILKMIPIVEMDEKEKIS